MSKKTVVKYVAVIVRDKTVSSHTSGSVTTTKQGNNVSVSNNIGTNVKLELVLEFPDGDLLPVILLNESLHAPVGKKILMAFKEGEPIAYQVTPVGQVYPLGYVTEKSSTGSQEFWGLTMPLAGTFFSLALLALPLTYYEDGEMKNYNGGKIVAAAGLAFTALATYIGRGWLGYIIGTALSGIATLATSVHANSKENAGRKLMLNEIKSEFDKLKVQL